MTSIDKDGIESVVTISHKIKFTDSEKFITSSLSNAVDNFAEGIHTNKCKDCDRFMNMTVSRTI